jgi:saccharopine dehydrogenase-like NADP-dependent oxidoreductase
MRNADREWDVVVIGGGGAQARGMLEAAARGNTIGKWVAVDVAWGQERRSFAESLGLRTVELDLLGDPAGLRELLAGARLAANFAGPFYRTGSVVLDACIDAGTDYMDIGDDADATLDLLSRDEAAKAAGVRALLGMGSSPGVTNLFVRAAVDALGSAAQADIYWVIAASYVHGAALDHYWHIHAVVDFDGTRRPVAAWSQLERRTIAFPEPIGERALIELAHPEPITLPRFLPLDRASNYGGLMPDDPLVVSWALARLGAGGSDTIELDGHEYPVSTVAMALYEQYGSAVAGPESLGGGLVVDVHTDGDGYRFASGDDTSMEESTGTPAAAGIQLMLDGKGPEAGVFAPECLEPGDFFPVLGQVSRSSGSLTLHRLESGATTERVRIRDLIAVSPRT